MTSAVFPIAKKAFADADIDWLVDTIKLVLLSSTYAYNAAHDFYDDLSGVLSTSGALTGKTTTGGVFKATAPDPTFPTVLTGTGVAVVAFQDTGNVATSRLIHYYDGRFQVEVAVSASSAAVTVVTEDLPADIASGVTLTKISGTGPATIVTSAGAAAGGRALTVTAIGSGITAGAVYEYAASGTNLPIPANGGNINFTIPAAGIFAL